MLERAVKDSLSERDNRIRVQTMRSIARAIRTGVEEFEDDPTRTQAVSALRGVARVIDDMAEEVEKLV